MEILPKEESTFVFDLVKDIIFVNSTKNYGRFVQPIYKARIDSSNAIIEASFSIKHNKKNVNLLTLGAKADNEAKLQSDLTVVFSNNDQQFSVVLDEKPYKAISGIFIKSASLELTNEQLSILLSDTCFASVNNKEKKAINFGKDYYALLRKYLESFEDDDEDILKLGNELIDNWGWKIIDKQREELWQQVSKSNKKQHLVEMYLDALDKDNFLNKCTKAAFESHLNVVKNRVKKDCDKLVKQRELLKQIIVQSDKYVDFRNNQQLNELDIPMLYKYRSLAGLKEYNRLKTLFEKNVDFIQLAKDKKIKKIEKMERIKKEEAAEKEKAEREAAEAKQEMLIEKRKKSREKAENLGCFLVPIAIITLVYLFGNQYMYVSDARFIACFLVVLGIYLLYRIIHRGKKSREKVENLGCFLVPIAIITLVYLAANQYIHTSDEENSIIFLFLCVIGIYLLYRITHRDRD